VVKKGYKWWDMKIWKTAPYKYKYKKTTRVFSPYLLVVYRTRDEWSNICCCNKYTFQYYLQFCQKNKLIGV